MSDALPYTRGPLIPRLLGIWNYFNNYFAMYTRLTRSRIGVELASPLLLGVRNYLNNYFAKYYRLTCSRIRVELTSAAYNFLLNV